MRARTLGRDGLLTHSYLLGPNGDSNGCVSFKNYDKFLTAFENGEVKRLVVVVEPQRCRVGVAQAGLAVLTDARGRGSGEDIHPRHLSALPLQNLTSGSGTTAMDRRFIPPLPAGLNIHQSSNG